MLVLRKNWYEVTHEQKRKLLQFLSLDTEPENYKSVVNKILNGEKLFDKNWMGYSYKNKVDFRT